VGATDKEGIRADFASGLPKLTYQELFIVDSMKRRTRVPGVSETSVNALARAIAPDDAISASAVHKFEIDSGRIAYLRSIAKAHRSLRPPDYDTAKECARLHYAKYYSTGNLPAVDASCQLFLESARLYPPPLSNETILELVVVLQQRDETLRTAIKAGIAFVDWYDGIPTELRARAVQFLEWVMISEKMSDEWSALETSTSSIRVRHLDFLQARVGKGLRGIALPSPAQAEP
jgi:hypothetical protein